MRDPRVKAFKFSKLGILAMPRPTTHDWVLYPDSEQKYLYVRVTANGARSFVVDKNNVQRGRVRITLGRAGTDSMTAVQAREQARIAVGMLAEGYGADQIKVRLARAQDRIPEGSLTLDQMLEQYLAERKHRLAERTVADYRDLVKTYLADWKHRPLEAIDETAVTDKFTSIKSPSRANYTFRLVRALFNFARSIRNETGAPIVTDNPVAVLSQRRIWHTDKPSREVVELAHLPAWWKAVKGLEADAGTICDYLRFLLLTGLRRNEAATLRWENVDLASKMFTVSIQTKNREPHALPLSDHLHAMLKRRHAAMLKRRQKNPKLARYVFPGENGPLMEPKATITKVVTASGVQFSSHTLRRTFASIAESLDIPYLALKRLLNHKAQDVTGKHYTVIGVERLRKPMQRITDFVLRAAKAKKTAQVVNLRQRKAA